jgi:hypothetical protein
MPKYQEFSSFQSNYLGAVDLDGPTQFIIESIDEELIGRDKEPKVVITLRGQRKKWIINRTNARSLAKMFGDDTDNWIGKTITLITPVVEFQGESKPAIRVMAKPMIRRPAPPPIKIELDDKIPAFDGPPDPPPADENGNPL